MGPIHRTCAPEPPSPSEGRALHKAAVAPWGRQGARAPLGVPTPTSPQGKFGLGQRARRAGGCRGRGRSAGNGCAVRWGRDGSSAGRRVTGVSGRGARAPDPRE